MGSARQNVRLSGDYQFKGVDATLLENENLRLFILDGKGGDIIEFRDKRTDVDVLWRAPHDWQVPDSPRLSATDDAPWETQYPGGWQVNAPLAGWGGSVSGTEYPLHGESALLAWETEVVSHTADCARLRLSTELVRYPFEIHREIELRAGESTVEFRDRLVNTGDVPLEYIWQQHIALGPPLVGPPASISLPDSTCYVDPSYPSNPTFEHHRLEPGAEFTWPSAPGTDGETVDLSGFPPRDATIHDQIYATDLAAGWYAVTNPELDLGFGVSFPTDPFECLWYWQAFGGAEVSPYFGRNYNIGLEPTTAHPAGSIPDAQRENGSMKTLEPDEEVTATVTAGTFSADAVGDRPDRLPWH